MDKRPLLISIRDPLLLKSNDLVLVAREDGCIPPGPPGFGLFYRDTRYLSGYELRLHGTEPLLLASSARDGTAARIDLTNDVLREADGRAVFDHEIGLRRTLLVQDEAFTDAIAVRNFGTERATLPISVEFAARFEDVFVLRGTPPGRRGRMRAPSWDGAELRFAYEGADGVLRTLAVAFSPSPVVAPRATEGCAAHFELVLEPRQERELVVTCRVDERRSGSEAPPPVVPVPGLDAVRQARAAADAGPLEGRARVETPNGDLAEAAERSLADIALLGIQRGDRGFTAGGVPWFVCLFGRDSLIPAIQCLGFRPDLMARTARTLAALQGSKADGRTREEPGKILHELRVGEMAHLREVPQTPSYAAIDSTPLFLAAIARHAEWTGSLALFEELRPNIDRALAWLDRKAAEDEGGYVSYDGTTEGGQPVNQSWRDSGNGVLRADGGYPEPPLALVEVQGYAYQARLLIAGLLRRTGEGGLADRLEAAAHALRARFLCDFWMEPEGCYCLALERGGRQVASVASNTAQVLWTGIAAPEHAARIAERVMRPDMFSGWGVRTLSADHVRFSPFAYHQGSVWPFDNALIVSGLRRYGEDAAALRVADAMLDTARGFPLRRLPEFFGGSRRLPGTGAPPRTPRADPLQAWSAGAVPFMLTEMLGLRADGFGRRLHVRRPVLPGGVERLALRELAVADATISVEFVRRAGGVSVEAIGKAGDCELVLE